MGVSPRDLAAGLLRYKATLRLEGDRLGFTSPPGALSPSFRAELARRRPYLRDRLARVGGTPRPLLEERARRAQEELRTGRDAAGRTLNAKERSAWLRALANAQADLRVFAPATRNKGLGLL